MSEDSDDPIVYLVSRYPSLSHTFILREIIRLRACGFNIRTASINCIDRPSDQLAAEEYSESRNTFYVKGQGIIGVIKSVLQVAFKAPFSFFRGLFYSLWLGRRSFQGLVFSFFYFAEALILGVWMKRISAKHLHVHFGNAAATVGLIVSKVFSIPFSMSVHGPDVFFYPREWLLPEKIKGAQFVRCIGNYAQSQLRMWSKPDQWNKIKIVPLGVDPNVFSPKKTEKKDSVFELLCVGRLVRVKGQHVLVEAVDRLVKGDRSVHLTLVGDGPDGADLSREVEKKGLEKQITFAGAVSQDAIQDYYANADLFVLPSFAEGIPVVLMEAMALEIPCVTTYVNGIPELIRDDIDGRLVFPSDDQGLVSAIIDLMDHPDLCRRLGEEGRKRILVHYDLETNTNRLVQLLLDEAKPQLNIS